MVHGGEVDRLGERGGGEVDRLGDICTCIYNQH